MSPIRERRNTRHRSSCTSQTNLLWGKCMFTYRAFHGRYVILCQTLRAFHRLSLQSAVRYAMTLIVPHMTFWHEAKAGFANGWSASPVAAYLNDTAQPFEKG